MIPGDVEPFADSADRLYFTEKDEESSSEMGEIYIYIFEDIAWTLVKYD